MNKRFFVTVPISLMLVACEPQLTTVPNDMGFDPEKCEKVTIPEVCTGNPKEITINKISHAVAPPHFCIKKDDVVAFKIVPPGGDTGTVSIKPKKGKAEWLKGKNDTNPNAFVLQGPNSDGVFDYYVVFADGYCVDPRISVN